MTWAANLIKAQDGDVIIIPLALARVVGLPCAAFLRQAAYLSAVVEEYEGWFFLQQEGPGKPSGKTIFERLGSWQSALGLGPDAQTSIRRELKSLGLLEETRKGMVHGKLLYRVNSENYLNFLEKCGRAIATDCNLKQTGNPDCAPGNSGMNIPTEAISTSSNSRVDVYQDNRPRRRPNTTTTSLDESSGGDPYSGLVVETSIAPYYEQLCGALRVAGVKDMNLAQDLLDELAGAIEAGKREERIKVGDPVVWLRGVLSRDFRRVRCFEVQARRMASEKAAESRRAVELADLPSNPQDKETGQKLLEAIRKKRQGRLPKI